MKKKLLCLVLAVVMVAALFGGCGAKKDEGPKKVTALFFSLEGEYFSIFDTILKEQITAKGYEYESQSSNFDPVAMIEQIENAVAGGTDALWIWATDGKAIADACKAAREKGVKVYCFVSDPGEESRDVFRGSNQTQSGIAIAQLAMKWADQAYGDVPAGTIKTIVMGDPNSQENNDRFIAMQEEIKNDPRFEVLEAVGIATSTVEAQTTTENMFGKYDQIDCFICGGGEMALGVAAYVTSETSPISEYEKFGLFGTEINGETAASMSAGVIKGLIVNGGLVQDNVAAQVEQIDKLLKGEAVDPISMVEQAAVMIDDLAAYGY